MTVEQGTPEWFAMRLGKVTASRITDVLAKVKTGEAVTREDYRTELVVQRLTNQPSETFTNPAIEHGVAYEPIARITYEAQANVFVEQVSFVEHPTIEWFGCSPDGLVGKEGLIEIKCPSSKNHIKYLLGGKPPAKYVPQMQCQMAVTGRKWCDFVSYDPRLPEDLQLFVVRLERDEQYIKSMEGEVQKFLSEVNEMVTKLKGTK
jgi:putative phage-type endonuclease